MRIVKRTFTKPLSKALQGVKEHLGTGRVATGAESVLKAAYMGRVADLLLREDADERGAWDEATQEVRPGNQDLLNVAALQTLSTRGNAFALKPSDMPEPASMVALLRF